LKAFHTIAIPHKDIREGRFTMDVFAADLEQVCRNKGPDEYRDAETFFEKTYLTDGLQNLLDRVEKRLKGKGGESVIQIQTPFGGGKTHALIAMYHRAKEWKAKTVVLVGTEMSAGEETPWGQIERQLTGKVSDLTGKVTPGKKALRGLLERNQPILILMDEVLQYVTKAAGIRVEESTLAAQTMAFMQELTETAGALGQVSLVVTLPSSITEHYDESAERLFQQLQKVSGRMEKIFTPVQDNEIPKVIRRRLFSHVDEPEAKRIVARFIDYAEKEGILPRGMEPSEYRDRFLDAYPFMPEVVDVLYHRWGTFPTFQRTRGVLRLLSLVVHSLKNANTPYIGPGDIDLTDQEIRQELVKYIGSEYNGVIAADLTSGDSGARKVDSALGPSHRGLGLGRRAATTVFLYSFSGGHERGATLEEIKRTATTLENPASVVAEAAELMKSKLFYLQNVDDRFFFDSVPNLNRIRITRMENIKEADLVALEEEVLKARIQGERLKVFLWEEDPAGIPDTEGLKLVILRKKDDETIRKILGTKGQTPRVYSNTLFFIYPSELERAPFMDLLKRKIANESIDQDPHLSAAFHINIAMPESGNAALPQGLGPYGDYRSSHLVASAICNPSGGRPWPPEPPTKVDLNDSESFLV